MISEIIFMKGYGLYVWSAFSFTLISFVSLYVVTKTNFAKEQNKFIAKFGSLDSEKIKAAQVQSTNKMILANRISSKI